jgi:hypothetical protein
MSKTLFFLPGLILACGEEEKQEPNIAPEITSFSITPSEDVTTSTTVYCVMTGSDANNDQILLKYRWFDSEGTDLGFDTSLQMSPEMVQPQDEISCTASISDGLGETDSQTGSITIVNTEPTIDSFRINLEEAPIGETLVCTATASDADLENIEIAYEWSNAGTLIGSTSELLLTTDLVTQGDELTCLVNVTDSSNSTVSETGTVTIVNSTPTIQSVVLLPSTPTSQDDITCQASGVEDADGDEMNLIYSWHVDGVASTESSNVLAAPFSVDTLVECMVTAQDATSEYSLSVATTIQNTLPTIDSILVSPNTSVKADTLLSCSGSAYDVDGDQPSLSYEWMGNNSTLLGTDSTLQLNPTDVNVGDGVTCYVTATDINSGTATASDTVNIENSSPTVLVAADVTPMTPTTGTTATCTASFEDVDDGSLTETYEWTTSNGTVLSSSATYVVDANDTDPGDEITCTASATDTQGDVITSSAYAIVENTAPTNPTVSILETTPYAQEDDLTCNIDIESSDIDAQNLEYNFEWIDTNGTILQSSGPTTSLSNTLAAGATLYGSLTCSVHANDGIDDSAEGTASVFVDYSSNLLTSGDLVITEIMNNPEVVDDAYGEWFEIYNATANDINLLGLEIHDLVLSHTINQSVTVAAYDYVVLGRNSDVSTNGGVNIDYQFSSVQINNDTEDLSIQNSNGTMDSVYWVNGGLMPNSPGVSLTLSSDYLSNVDNDETSYWCESITEMSNGEYGTPGSENENCDFDADTILASLDCDDTDANLLDITNDGDCDGTDTAEDCDDSDDTTYPGAGDTFGDWVDSDCDGFDCDAETTNHTHAIIFNGNLDSSTVISSSQLSDLTFDGLNHTISTAVSMADYSIVVPILDNSSNPHDLTILFQKSDVNEWEYYAVVDAGELADPSSIGYTSEFAFSVFQGTLFFDSNGNLEPTLQINISLVTSWYFTGSSMQDSILDFGVDSDGFFTDGLLTQTVSASDIIHTTSHYSVDCPGNVAICQGDADCDGILTEDDCDDTDDTSTELATDADCDGVFTADDCDDTDYSLGAIVDDSDCNGVLDVDEATATSWDNCPITQTQGDAQYQFIGENADDNAGYSISTAGDVDNDGLDDILVGAYGNDDGGSYAGKTYLILGSSLVNNNTINLADADYSFTGENASDESGISVSTAGDVDNDGLDDILIGARWNSDAGDSAGKSYIFLGSSLGINPEINLANADYSFLGEASYDYAGIHVSTAGDVDNDGFSDILIGASGNDDGDVDAGKVYLVLGASLGNTSTISLSDADYSFIGEQSSDGVKKTYSAGDVDNDGLDDILISTNGNDDGGTDAGKSYIILGSSLGNTSTIDLANADYSFIGENSYDYSGYDVSSAGDIDNDGLDDILIGAFGNSQGGTASGKSYLILGSSLGSTSTINLSSASYSFIGEYAQDRSGTDVSSAGDVDNDGLADILIGSHANSEGGSYAGKAYLILGSSIGSTSVINLTNADYSFIGESADDNLREVASAGDVNGDGQSDILVGAGRNDQGGSNAGKVGLFMACE